MKSRNILLLISVSLLCAPLSSHAAGRATLTAGPRMVLAEEGTGPWNLTIHRGEDSMGRLQIGGRPWGYAVDNDGYIYICDTFGNKILVFTKDGEPHQVLTTEELCHPLEIIVDDDGVLHVDAVTKDKGEYIQYTVTREAQGWTFREKPKAELAPGVLHSDLRIGHTAPFGRDGLRYLLATSGYKWQLQLVDRNNNFVKLVPCKWHDQKGRFYKYRYDKNLERHVMTVLDESGTVLGEFVREEGGGLPIRYRDWVYYRHQKDGKVCLLRRYSEDGTIEHEIEVVGLEERIARREPTLLISPNSEYCFQHELDSTTGDKAGLRQVWVQRMTYCKEE